MTGINRKYYARAVSIRLNSPRQHSGSGRSRGRVFAFANPVRELLKETSTGIALPAQDFKRYGAVATFSDGDKSYSMIVCRILYGDMVHFLVLAKAYKSDNDNLTDTFSTNRTFRVGEDKKTIEETRSSSTANASRLDDGSVKTIYSSERFAQGAYSIAKSKRWSLGSLTETDFFRDERGRRRGYNDYERPPNHLLTSDLGYLPDRVRLFFDNFRTRC